MAKSKKSTSKTKRKRKLSAGVHWVNVKNCTGKSCRRKVRVKANGQWVFMKSK